MKPGERIRLITESAESLNTRPWPTIQLILREHGFKTYEMGGFSGEPDQLGYCAQQIEEGGNEQLIELHTYLLGDDAAPEQQQTLDRPWGTNPVAVFISHVHEDAAFASQVSDRLKKRWGIDAFVAHNDITPSEVWRNMVRSALASCHFMVAILHERFHASQWCDQEVGWAMGRRIPIMPVRFERPKERYDGFLEEYQDCVVNLGKGRGDTWLAQMIFEAVLSDPTTHQVGVRALAEAFVHSGSFAQTDRLWELISAEPHWESEQLRRLEYAVQTNDQIYNCRTAGAPVPNHVNALVEKFEPPSPKLSDPWSNPPI